MSCVCNKHQLEIYYNNIKHEKQGGFNNYHQLLQYIYTKYPDLRCYALTLFYKSAAISPETYRFLYQKDHSLEVYIEKSHPSQVFNLAIFKLRLKDDDLLSTGFFFTYTHAIVPSEFCTDSLIPNLRLLFEDETEIKVSEENEVISLGQGLSILVFKEKQTLLQPILFDLENLLTINQSYAYFYTRAYPILDKKPTEVLNMSSDYSIEVEEGAVGAPILSSESKLLGIVNSLNTVIPIKDLKTNFPESITFPAGFDLEIERQFVSFYPTTCYLNVKKKTAAYYSAEEAVNKIINFDLMIEGSTASCTIYGVVFVGLGLNFESMAILFDGQNLEKIPNPKKKHLFHCSVFHNDLLFIIGGNSAAVEAFNFRENSWKTMPSLNKRRSSASAISIKSCIYVVGGKRDTKYSKSILKFHRNKWKKIGLKLPCPLANLGLLLMDKDIIVFGGNNEENENLESWSIDLKDLQIKTEKFSSGLKFGRFNYANYSDEILIFSNNSKMIKYDKEGHDLYKVIVDKEKLEVNYF